MYTNSLPYYKYTYIVNSLNHAYQQGCSVKNEARAHLEELRPKAKSCVIFVRSAFFKVVIITLTTKLIIRKLKLTTG